MKKVFSVMIFLVIGFRLQAQLLAMHTEPVEEHKAVQQLNTPHTAYQWGIGLRVGDPTGLTVKRFLGSRALELSIGRSGMGNFSARREFDNDKYFESYVYLDSRFRSAVSLQLHYLSFKQIPIDGNDDLAWYVGLGGQLHSTTVDYRYRYWRNNDRRDRWESVTDVDFGADFTAGLDYTFHDVPLSLFADITLFVELLDDPLFLRLQGGGGIRYNF
ncbi:hypothetical protein OKW21_004913 [Catalinimonas alkaloidigena]|uniref:hypothetical protein n=1 Tax=Catalinimonas alkaloidigena TaxID=1075417 RepID=UPI002405B5E2|nr:hypothetical protein [Catalinimonas alkaloidigena]MDF9799650.1 hypothetical protein [Catalinimonas alkaloidigena]